jgi:crossover junction endodeoxyribonuclease RuvC
MTAAETLPGRIVGVDPGLNTTGYAVLESVSGKLTLVEAGVVRGRSKASLELRLCEIYAGIGDVIAAFRPAAMAVEQLYSHYDRPRTAILMAHARGVICLAAAQHELSLHSYAATQVKSILTGNGRAPKSQVQRAICQQFGLAAPPEPADVADAMAIALCHHFLKRQTASLQQP